ncbi:MAG: ankyrin repeat domain-containing protein [Bacteroidota bacterium]
MKNDANPNVTQQDDITPIHEAAHHGKTALVKLLVEYKANVNAKMKDGKTPLSMALERSFNETAELIRALGGH